MTEIVGYKAFKADLTNKYGQQFLKGIEYAKTTELKFGLEGHGYHFCINLEDTFRYFSPTRDNVVCKVIGSGNFIKVSNYAYDSGDMYVSEKIKIIEQINREQIFEYALTCNRTSLNRLLALYCFEKEELEILKEYCLRENYLQELSTMKEFQTASQATFKRSKLYLYGNK